MKTLKLLILITAFVILFSFATNTFAIMRAPNQNSLQPMPANVEPNVSGNINYTAPYDPSYENMQNLSAEASENESPSSVTTVPSNPSDKNQSNYIWYWLVAVILIITIGLFKLYPSQNR